MDIEKAIKKELSNHGINYVTDNYSRLLKEKMNVPMQYELFGLGRSSLFCMDGEQVIEWRNEEINRWDNLKDWVEATGLDIETIRKEAAITDRHCKFE